MDPPTAYSAIESYDSVTVIKVLPEQCSTWVRWLAVAPCCCEPWLCLSLSEGERFKGKVDVVFY